MKVEKSFKKKGKMKNAVIESKFINTFKFISSLYNSWYKTVNNISVTIVKR